MNFMCETASIPFSSIRPGIKLTYRGEYVNDINAVEQSATPVTLKSIFPLYSSINSNKC